MVEDKVCFVICPIGKTGSDTRKRSDLTLNYIIKPVVEEFGYRPIRADQINESGMITYQIIDYIIDSPLVIADLTDNNPNVFYELAIRHIVERPYIQMIKSDQKIPFDVSGMRTILFDIDVEQADSAKKELSEQIKSIENNEFKPHNPYTLSINYSAVQNILKERENIEPSDITNIVLKSVNELRSMIDDMRNDFHNLKSSMKNSYDVQQDMIERKKKLHDVERELNYNMWMLDKAIKNNDPAEVENYKKNIEKIKHEYFSLKNPFLKYW